MEGPKVRIGSAALTLTVFLLALPVLGLSREADCTHRTVSVRIAGANGATVQGFSAPDFAAELDKKAVKILSATPDTRPHRIVILLDSSGSMRGNWSRLLWLAGGLAEQQLPGTQIALLEFSDRTLHTVEFSPGPEPIVDRLRRLLANPSYAVGSTGLYDALSDALQLLRTPTSADALYLVGDGEDNVSRTTFEKARRLIGVAGVRVFVSLVFDSESRGMKRARSSMGELASESGGEVIEPFSEGVPRKEEELARFAERMNAFQRRMIEGELLQIELPEPLKKARDWKLTLTHRDNEQQKIRIVYPSQLFPCTQ